MAISRLSNALANRKLSILAAGLLTAAVPFGFEQLGIYLCYLLGGLLLLSSRLDSDATLFFSFSVIFVALQIILNVLFDVEVSYWQVLRTMSYSLLSFVIYGFVVCNKNFNYAFFKYEKYIATFIFILFLMDVVFGVRLYSSSLVVGESSRIYVFSPMLFYLLLCLSFYEGRSLALFYLVLILATLQKSILVCIFLLFVMMLMFRSKNLGARWVISASVLSLGPVIYFGSDILNRFQEFLAVGDLWRLEEIVLGSQAFLNDAYSVAFGHGVGVPYRDLQFDMLGSDSERLAVNMTYDVHNLYIDLLMKFGVIYTLAYMIFIARQLKRLPRILATPCLVFFVVQGASSPAIFHSVDALGFMLGLALLVGRFKFCDYTEPKGRTNAEYLPSAQG